MLWKSVPFAIQTSPGDRPVIEQNCHVQYSAPSDPVQGSNSIAAAMAAEQQQMMIDGGDQDFEAVGAEAPMQEPVRVEKTPGRNEPCFCGSGKKYKLCHGR